MGSPSARVLLVWPGTTGAAAGNFGVPQLVSMATYVRERTGASVDIVDLECERAFGSVSVPKILLGPDGRGYDVVGLACYASYDHLKCHAIAEIARALLPDAVILAGGYHASACPEDIVYDGSPYDVCIVGEGERPLARVVASVAGGAPLRNTILGSDPIDDLSELPPTDWSFLARYRAVARRMASQTQVYLSRGCPFECVFCMERAKREVSWRALPVERALDELKRLHAFLDLSPWTLYIADALFGMKTSWRKSFLEALARDPVPTQKTWLLIRVDLVDDDDLALFARTNCGLGFGLESGDPTLLATIRKAGRLEDYLDRMRHVSDTARALNVPWGANVIVGHPGETEASLRRSARYLRELFLDPRGTTGFLSVDPFRLYPGSPIDGDRAYWERRYGTRFHRPRWWHDGDQEFLSEWVDPSRELDYRRRETLTYELLGPVLETLPQHFVYRGPAQAYFHRALTGQIDNLATRNRLHFAERFYAWHRYLRRIPEGEARLRDDPGLSALARDARRELLPAVAKAARIPAGAWLAEPCAPLRSALEDTPRERFVALDQVGESTRDVALPLDASGQATVSALHAYARAFHLAGIRAGDRVLDLGCGTGYGTALLAALVGPTGRVHGVEIDPVLAARAADNLREIAHATVGTGDATDPRTWALTGPTHLVAGFALPALPPAWLDALAPGVVVVAPLVTGATQRLARATRTPAGLELELHEEVRYVSVRHQVPRPSAPAAAVDAPAAARDPPPRVHLPLAPTRA